MVLPRSVLEAAKGATGFGETVVHVFGDRGVTGDYIAEVCKLLRRVSGWPLTGIWGGLYTACGEFW